MEGKIKKIVKGIKEKGWKLQVIGLETCIFSYDKSVSKFGWSENSSSAYISLEEMQDAIRDYLFAEGEPMMGTIRELLDADNKVIKI